MCMQMVGHIEQDGVLLPKPTIRGAWDAELVADMPDGSAWTIFSMHPLPPQPNRRAADPPCSRISVG